MIVIDASVWISYFLPTDVNYAPTRNWLGTYLLSNSVFFAPTLVLAEVGGAVSRRAGQFAQAYQALQELRDITTLNLIEVDESLGSLATEIAINQRLRGADATYVAVAQQLNIPLITWDREIINRTSGIIQCLSP
jgi:predicted nucleic acid-binding protein